MTANQIEWLTPPVLAVVIALTMQWFGLLQKQDALRPSGFFGRNPAIKAAPLIMVCFLLWPSCLLMESWVLGSDPSLIGALVSIVIAWVSAATLARGCLGFSGFSDTARVLIITFSAQVGLHSIG